MVEIYIYINIYIIYNLSQSLYILNKHRTRGKKFFSKLSKIISPAGEIYDFYFILFTLCFLKTSNSELEKVLTENKIFLK